MTNFPNGLASFGVPVTPASVPATSGKVFFVHSSGSNGNSGKDTAHPLATVAAAIAKCTADKGDTVLVMPGHTETLTAAAAIAVNVSGVRIVGLGTGRNRPVFNYTTAVGASFDVTAANALLVNLVFKPLGIDNVTAAVNVQAADCIIRACEFELANATNQAALGILTNASADRLVVEDCFFHGTSDAGTTNAIQVVGGDSIVIRRNYFHGAYASGSGAIQNVTTACTRAVIEGNVINNLTAACTKAMVFAAASTGQIARNYMQILSGTAPITGAAMSWVGGNYYAATIATAGTLV